MCNALLDQFFCFESRLEWTHEYAGVHLKQIDLLECHSTIDLTGANRKVRESSTNDLFLVSFILHQCTLHFSSILPRLVNEVNVVLNTLHFCLLHATCDASNSLDGTWVLHFHVLCVRLVELVFAFLLLDHLEVSTFHFLNFI